MMPSNKELISDLDSILLQEITKLAAANFGPSDIALKLDINRPAFMRVWRDQDSKLREAYEQGRLEIEAMKSEELQKQIAKGNLTALQIHDKKTEEARIEALKKEIFSLE